jgi:hypothetical protein
MNTSGRRRAVPVFLCGALGAQIPPVPMQSQANPAATIALFQADRFVVRAGEPVEFLWETRNADSVVLQPLGAKLPTAGNIADRPQATTVYWLSVTNLYGGESWPLEVRVLPAGSGTKEPARNGLKAAGPASRPKSLMVEPGPASGTGYWVQFIALSNREAAETLAARLSRRLGEPVTLESAASGTGAVLFRVHSGPYASRAAALGHWRSAQGKREADLPRPLIVEGSPPLPDGSPVPKTAKPPRRHHRGRPAVH